MIDREATTAYVRTYERRCFVMLKLMLMLAMYEERVRGGMGMEFKGIENRGKLHIYLILLLLLMLILSRKKNEKEAKKIEKKEKHFV